MAPGANPIQVFMAVVFVKTYSACPLKGLPGTITSLLRKSVNYGRKKFYSAGPRQLSKAILSVEKAMTKQNLGENLFSLSRPAACTVNVLRL